MFSTFDTAKFQSVRKTGGGDFKDTVLDGYRIWVRIRSNSRPTKKAGSKTPTHKINIIQHNPSILRPNKRTVGRSPIILRVLFPFAAE